MRLASLLLIVLLRVIVILTTGFVALTCFYGGSVIVYWPNASVILGLASVVMTIDLARFMQRVP